jgi:DNA-binding transcriptional MerR regulator
VPGGPDLLSSGEFARRSHLSPKALRIYDDLGLLQPLEVDPSNGYRRYGAGQVYIARLIAMLRGIDMSLSEIASMLTALEAGSEIAVQRLDRHMSELEIHHTSRRLLARHINAILKGDDPPMFTIATRHVPARRMMTVQRRLRASETDKFVLEAKRLFTEHLGGTLPIESFSLIFHGVVDHESDGPIEAVLTCSNNVEPTELIGIRTEEAHDEAFTTITKAQWDYPAILAAYDAVACSSEVVARPDSRLSCREVYLAEPDAISDEDHVCDIAFPLGDSPTADPDPDS